jgi:hypothetical protein
VDVTVHRLELGNFFDVAVDGRAGDSLWLRR